jgi:hypothetical protein
MELTKSDYTAIVNLMKEDGGFIEYKKDGEILYFDYDVEVDGHLHVNDRYGAYSDEIWITTSASVIIENAECYSEDGEMSLCDFDEYLLGRMYEQKIIS